MAKGIQSISIGFRLLKAIVDSETPLPLKTLAGMAKMSPSSARMYLISLIETGLVAQNSQSGLYGLGPYTTHLGARAIKRIDLMEIASEAMRSLREATGAHVLLCTWSDNGITIVSRTDGAEVLPINFRIGGTASLTSSATGKVFLAFGPQAETNRHLNQELKSRSLGRAEQAKLLKKLDQEVSKIRREMVAYSPEAKLSSGVALSGFGAIAAPIFAEGRQLRFVISGLYLKEGNRLDRVAMIRIIREIAERASTLAGASWS